MGIFSGVVYVREQSGGSAFLRNDTNETWLVEVLGTDPRQSFFLHPSDSMQISGAVLCDPPTNPKRRGHRHKLRLPPLELDLE